MCGAAVYGNFDALLSFFPSPSIDGCYVKKKSHFFAATLSKMTKTITAAKESDVHVVSAGVLENVKSEGIIARIKASAISDWGSDPKKRIGALLDKAREGAKSGEFTLGFKLNVLSGTNDPMLEMADTI